MCPQKEESVTEVPGDAMQLWDYLRLSQLVHPAECLLVMGTTDMGVARRAAELYRQDIAPFVLVTGGPGPARSLTEADRMAREMIRQGVPEKAIACERLAANMSENFWLSAELLRDLGRQPRSFLAVTRPYAERRLMATAGKRWPFRRVCVASERASFSQYWDSPEQAAPVLAGEVLKLHEYSSCGLISTTLVPEVILATARMLAHRHSLFPGE
jgi:hypothetical protein